ncbi:MAG: serine--tRNA ligase [Nitrososphaerota archaeon]|jgi:seryl-tRNA synthetase|uniref:serine--tRNA ligase n=1 Tax=Candidatus Bathycorpusculum sp. TaxID=2994959 RepID=UPI002824164B|nr:serine--tRNA ligase [Candidatus Termiticorpusculum sp.]MCL2257149.1 serine--tRNA ligase [Candidatus Termiticorpusculum sp.]MCL2292706.1 serine--tRNA ligase [Candidatus Termiticorpusculum sp.]MDR0461346.1 serine--tRNA ligase [Nitrososphaerota archaeon]
MLDIKLIRENPDLVRANLEKRGNPENMLLLDELFALDKQWRMNLTRLNDLRHVRKTVTIEIAQLKKTGQDALGQVERAKEIDVQITTIEKQVAQEENREHNLLLCLPNMLDPTVPLGEDAHGNVQIKTWGTIPTFNFQIKNHIDLANALGIVDMERAGKISGARFFFLKNQLVLLDLALMSFTMHELSKKGYVAIEPPFMMNKTAYEGVTSLADFADVLYKIEGEDLYMIATSEHPMAAMYMGEVIKEQDLPLKLAGLSPCFRKEAGAHGKDTRGIFRTHQFNKIEQFIFCKPEDSVRLHEELLAAAEELLKKLELPYRVVNVCTGDIGTVAAKKYDIEAWMPAQNDYREVVSCSNCTDYQARRLGIRYREKEGAPPKGFLHTLNSTAVATGRTMVALLENNQNEDGTINVPKALRKYMSDFEKIDKNQ